LSRHAAAGGDPLSDHLISLDSFEHIANFLANALSVRIVQGNHCREATPFFDEFITKFVDTFEEKSLLLLLTLGHDACCFIRLWENLS
jgi:hypothetical protein